MSKKKKEVEQLDRTVREVEMELECVLNPAEREDTVTRAVTAHQELLNHLAEASLTKSGLSAKEKRLEKVVNGLMQELRDGTVLRKVKVQQVFDMATNCYWEVRLDTNEEVPESRRALEAHERQRELGLELTEEQKKLSDFVNPDPVEAAVASELNGAPTNSGRAG